MVRKAACLFVVGLFTRVASAQETIYLTPLTPHEYAAIVVSAPVAVMGAAAVSALLGLDSPQPVAASEPVFQPAAPSPFMPDPPLDQRVALLRVRARFRTGDEIGSLQVLRLSARYSDGLVVKLNGTEVARRNAEAIEGTAYATRAHGPETEVFYVPVVPGLLVRGENVLDFDVHPAVSRRRPNLEFGLVGGSHPRIVRGPIVQRVGPASASLVFEADAPISARVKVGEKWIESPAALRHVVGLTGLAPDAETQYQVVTPFERLSSSFRTGPQAGDVIRFVVYGDVRTGHDVHAEIVRAIQKEDPDFVIGTGDMVRSGYDEADWQRYFAVSADLLSRTPLYPAIGNHDVGTSGNENRRFEDVFALWPGPPDRPSGAAWYGFRIADVQFVMLDSNAYGNPLQLAWLETELAAARRDRVRAIFAVTHAGPYSRGPHGGARDALAYVPVLLRYRTTVLFSGHDHLYQRGKIGALHYVVSGGGGAPLYDVRCGIKGTPRCKDEDGAKIVASEHHYVTVEVFPASVRLCPKRPDGSPLEACTLVALRR